MLQCRVLWFCCHVDILHSDSKYPCWHIFSVISRQSGAHQTCTKQQYCSVASVFLALKQYSCEVAILSYLDENNVLLCARNATCQNNSLATLEDMDEGENQLYALTIH